MKVLYTKSVGFSVFLKSESSFILSFMISLPPHVITTDRQENTYESCNSIENLGEPASPSARMEILEKHSSILFLPIQPSFHLKTILHII